MDIVNRVKNILVSPKDEWQTIDTENAPHGKVCVNYLLLLALIPAAACLIGYGVIGYHGLHFFEWGIRMAIVQFITVVAGAYITAFVIDALAENFGASKNFDKAFSLVAYSYTAVCVAGVFYLIPSLYVLAIIGGLYSLYLLYIGFKPLMKSPDDKTGTYFVVSLAVLVVVFGLLSWLLKHFIVDSAFNSLGRDLARSILNGL